MSPRMVSIAAAAVALGLTISVAGCEQASDEPASDAAASSEPGLETLQAESLGVPTTEPGTSARVGADEGWRPLAVPEPGRPDTYPLVVRNPHDVPLAVFADGGAGEVLLDTVAARDSSRIRLLIAADSVTLRAVGLEGVSGSEERIALDPESEVGWEARF